MTDTDTYEVEEFARIGRTFEEYAHMFDLEPATLTDRSVLDCPSGVASFVATAHEREIPATGADLIYGQSVSDLERQCKRDYEHAVSELSAKKELFEWDFYGDVEQRCQLLRQAYETFLDDYPKHSDRYVPAALPELPFVSNAFSVVLSAHFLFLYGDRLDYEFHITSLRELARVAADEVRIFPLTELDTSVYSQLDAIIEELQSDGFTVERRRVPFEFQTGANEMLQITDT
ncbi:hypothetical protein [Halocatena marina]|uniref:hypothetical protein n=1 Tax=Halocatena marina TaxID=2934937 RepID=UPI00200F2405|nr:hypothetical protein [Halocatena marina]